MNIAFISNLWPPTIFGGYEILAHQLADLLKAQGHGVEVLCSDFVENPPDGVAARLELTTPFPRADEDVGEVDFSLRRQRQVSRTNYRIAEAWMAELDRRFADGRGADVVFCWCLNRLSLGPMRAAQDRGLPVCWTINDFHPRQFKPARLGTGLGPGEARKSLRWLAERTLFRRLTLAQEEPRVAFISQALREGLEEEGLGFEKGEVIPQGVPLAHFPFKPRWRDPGEPLDVLYVGQLSQAKGVHTLLRGFAKSVHDGPIGRLRLAGDGVPSYRRELHRLAARLGISERVDFLGQVDHGEIANRHRCSHVLVFSSEWPEPFGLAHLEAMASGCAVISTLTGGSAELIRDRHNALAYPAGDRDHLARQLGELARDEELRRCLIVEARGEVEATYGLESYGRRLTDFLHRTLEAVQPPGRTEEVGRRSGMQTKPWSSRASLIQR